MKKEFPHIRNMPDHEESSRDAEYSKKNPGSDHDHKTEIRRGQERQQVKKEEHEKNHGK